MKNETNEEMYVYKISDQYSHPMPLRKIYSCFGEYKDKVERYEPAKHDAYIVQKAYQFMTFIKS